MFLCHQLFSQVFREEQPLFDEEPFFNETWVRENKILRIRGEVSFKRDDFPIDQSEQFYDYLFNERGQLVRSMRTYRIRHRLDTVYHHYYYGSEGRLIKMVSSDAYGYYALNYVYKNDHLVRIFHSRETPVNRAKGTFERDHIVWNDSISWEKIPSGEKGTYYNMAGRPYKTVTRWWNEEGRLSKTQSRSIIGDDVTTVDYSWSESGRLLYREEHTTLSGNHEFTRKFTYDTEDRLDMEIIGKDGSLYTTRKITYTPSGLIELQLLRNDVTRIMEIVEFTYEYY